MVSRYALATAARVMDAGGIIAYPTEAVYGLGCDPLNPRAIMRLLELKGRERTRGLIVVAHERRQLEPFLRPLPAAIDKKLEASWPGPVTWIVPARDTVPGWLTGDRDTIAVRVSAHPVVAALCARYDKAIVSTSANRSGRRPARTALELRRHFRNALDFVLVGPLGEASRPTEIRDALTGEILRKGSAT